MKITQISVFLENRKGRLLEVCSILGDNNINILALTIAETEDFGIARMIVNKPEDAVKILKEKSFAANITDVVIVEVEDKPGGLAKILGVLDKNNINLEYMHTFIKKTSENAYMVFRFDDPDQAISVLKDNKINIIEKVDN